MLRLLRYGLMAGLITITIGCASRTKQAPSPEATTTFLESGPVAQLRQRAAAEAKATARRPVASNVPLPPGLGAGIVDRRSPDDPRAFKTLQQALAEFAEPELEAATSIPEVDADQRNAALKHYAKARIAATDGRMFQAVIELQKAHELDPASPEILRELGRCYLAANGTTQAMSAFEKLLQLDPNDTDALLTVGMALANRRDFGQSLKALGRLMSPTMLDRLDEPNRIVVQFAVATALRELGYDTAFIQAAEPTVAFAADAVLEGGSASGARLASIYRQRGETWRAIGEAHARLGNDVKALDAYAAALKLPTADPSALHARMIHAHLTLQQPLTAQATFLNAILATGEPPALSERDVQLCSFLRAHAGSTDLLAQIVTQWYRDTPGESLYARAAAALSPPEKARELLRLVVAQKPRDLHTVQQLLTWVAAQNPTNAADLAVMLASEHPDLSDAYADRLAYAIGSHADALNAVQQLAPSAAKAHMHAKLLTKFGGVGEAWTICEQARQTWPNDRALALQQLQLAAIMQEPMLFEQTLASIPLATDRSTLIGLAQAHRALGQFEKAVEVATQATMLAPDDADAMVERSRAHLALGASKAGAAADPQQLARISQDVESAITAAEQALEIMPASEGAFETLALIYMPNGIRADTNSFRDLLQRMRSAAPQSPLLARLLAQDDIANRRFDRALDRLLTLFETNPLEGNALTLAVTVWQQLRRLDAAQQWIETRLAQRPSDPALLEQWVRVRLLQGQTDDVVKRLEAAASKNENDLLARRLLETVYRATNQSDAAMELGERRLLSRPQAIRREIELAALYAGAERAERALVRLEWVRDHASTASLDELSGALRVLSRIDAEAARRDALTMELVALTTARYPAAPLQVYGAGLLTLARAGQLNDDFRALAAAAAAHATAANGPGTEAANEWRELAQALVDDGHPVAAALAVRARLASPQPLDDPALAGLATIALVADAAADSIAHDPSHVQRSMQLLRELDRQNKLSPAVNADEGDEAPPQPPIKLLARGMYEVSVFYTQLGSRAGADLLLKEALTLEPDFPMAMNNLGYAQLEESGAERPEVAAMIERAATLMPNDPNILDTLGWLRYKQGRFNDVPADANAAAQRGALSLIQGAIAAFTVPSPEVLDHLGDVHWRLGDDSAAAQAWRQAAGLVEDEKFKTWMIQNLQIQQTRIWQLVVSDPQAMYDREYRHILERAKAKLAALDAGTEPAVAPLFSESPQQE